MNKTFYLKLAFTNLKKNAKTYFPYLLTCIVSTMMFYMILSLSLNPELTKLNGGLVVQEMLLLGSYIVGIFAFIFLFYTNSFLIKRRKKEFGIFNILGMEKKHIAIVIAWESIITLISSLCIGIFIGISFDKILYLIIGKLLNASLPLGFYISWKVVKITVILFVLIQLCIYIRSLFAIRLTNPITLLKSSNLGEKEPKARWVLSIVGVVLLCIGYYISITTTNPMGALNMFFLAVIFVMIGTYFLFTTGSIALLKLLKKNKKFYYQTNHFINISGMMYRMKQNAVGLANICILSTMVLVTISSTLSLWVGIEDSVYLRYPREFVIEESINQKDKITQEMIDQEVQEDLNKNHVDVQDKIQYTYVQFSAIQKQNQFIVEHPNESGMKFDDVVNLFVMTQEDYNKNMNKNVQLDNQEVLVYSNRKEFNEKELQLFDQTWKVKDVLDTFVENGNVESYMVNTVFIVVKDDEILDHFYQKQKEIYKEYASEKVRFLSFNTPYKDAENLKLFNILRKEGNYSIEARCDSYRGYIALNGGILFLGIFLSILFMIAAILIMYYKQISEGFEDKERYEIMQKVGMDQRSVKKSINSQILLVFFMPLIAASIHTLFAFPIISRLLKIMQFTNTKLFLGCLILCIVVFGIVYSIVYKLTSKLYYSIVKR